MIIIVMIMTMTTLLTMTRMMVKTMMVLICGDHGLVVTMPLLMRLDVGRHEPEVTLRSGRQPLLCSGRA